MWLLSLVLLDQLGYRGTPKSSSLTIDSSKPRIADWLFLSAMTLSIVTAIWHKATHGNMIFPVEHWDKFDVDTEPWLAA